MKRKFSSVKQLREWYASYLPDISFRGQCFITFHLGVFIFALLLFTIYPSRVEAESVSYGAGLLVPSKGGATTPSQTAIIYHVTSSGSSVLSSSGGFVPVLGKFSVEGPLTSGILRNNSVTPVKEQAMVEGWTHVKRGESIIGWALKLGRGQIVIPINKGFLDLVLVNEDNEVRRSPSPDDRYPVDGRLRARLISFNDCGAVLEMGEGGGLYVMERDGGAAGYVTLADDPHFTIISTTPALRAEARKLLKSLYR